MIIEREILEDKLKDLIIENAKNRNVKKNITNILKEKNLDEGYISSIFKFQTSVAQVNQSILYVFTKAMFEATKNEKINPKNYFTELQIEEGDKWTYKIKEKIKDEEPIKFTPCVKINNYTWLTRMTVRDAYNFFESRKLVYNVKTQRPLQIKKINERIVPRLNTNSNAIDKMKRLMAKDLYFPDPITINMLVNESLNYKENENDMSVIMYAGELNAIDGWHRLRSYFLTLVENMDWEEYIPVQLMMLTEDRAIDYIFQKSQHNPIDKEYIDSINPEKLSNQVVEFLNSERKSMLRGRITKNEAELKSSNKEYIINFNTLSNSIDLTFNPQEQTELFGLSKYMMEGFNHIINIFNNLLNEEYDEKKWCVYTCLLYLIKDSEDWKGLLDDILLDLNVDNIVFKTVNKFNIKNITTYIKDMLKKYDNYEV